MKSLVNYVRCRGHHASWPACKATGKFWSSASDFVHECTPNVKKRTGIIICVCINFVIKSVIVSKKKKDLDSGKHYTYTCTYIIIVWNVAVFKRFGNLPTASACRNKVINTLRKKFKSPLEAETHYYSKKITAEEVTVASGEVAVTPVFRVESIPELTTGRKLQLITEMYRSYCLSLDVRPHDDFIELSVLAMKYLHSCQRSNVVYKLVKCLGTMRSDNSDSLLPARRMPMGLIEHCVDFFCSSSSQEVCLNIDIDVILLCFV